MALRSEIFSFLIFRFKNHNQHSSLCLRSSKQESLEVQYRLHFLNITESAWFKTTKTGNSLMKRSALIERRSPWNHPALVVCVRGKYGCHVGLEELKEAYQASLISTAFDLQPCAHTGTLMVVAAPPSGLQVCSHKTVTPRSTQELFIHKTRAGLNSQTAVKTWRSYTCNFLLLAVALQR